VTASPKARSLLDMDPRIRERRVGVLREAGRRRLRLLGCALAVAALASGAWLLLHTGFFSARHVTVRGAAHTSTRAVIAAAGLSGHPPLVDVDAGGVAARVDRLPWVLTADVHVRWPDSVTIDLRERVPVAVVGSGGSFVLVDGTGRVLARAPGPPAGLVQLDVSGGGSREPGSPGSTLGRAAAPGLAVARSLPPALQGRVSAIEVGRGGSVDLDLGGGVRALLGPDTELQQKFESLASVLAGARVPQPAQIDLTVPDEVEITHL
jgi:cell division protein FtsQ